MHPLESYLAQLRDIHATGAAVDETSYYGALENLFNEIGKKLKPKVRCVIQLKNRGAGHPDGGLFTADQFEKKSDAEPLRGQKPARGAIEVKATGQDAWVTVESRQVTDYWKEYGQVLVTNYRDFVLIGKDENGQPVRLETYRLAPGEPEFWEKVHHPRLVTKAQGDAFLDFLRRVILHAAPLKDPEDVAWFLASYAREARMRVESQEGIPGLVALRKGLEEALGMKFEGADGDHFFRATLVQTLFYGVFSSWVLWARNVGFGGGRRFHWREAAWNLHVPMIASLFDQIATPQKLKPLGLDEVLDWAEAVLSRVDRAAFFDQFEEEHAVQYFYEPFLKAYDPELRKKLGVWYTPPEIVQYQVARVDTVLREELGIEDGLADPNVYVLDPCCGTAAYIVEVLRRIHDTLKEKGTDALVAQRLKQAAMERVFGFEILPAPFVVSHMQIGLLLRRLGAPFSDDKSERAAVYLTNALTGWEPPKGPKAQIVAFPELQKERDAADDVKQKAPILVILGNPPYNAFAGTSPEEEEGLVEDYKGVHFTEGKATKGGARDKPQKKVRHYLLSEPVSKGGWGIKKFNLDDLYVRFFRIAERRIVKGGRGVLCYISNFSYLSDPSFVIMRQNFLREFDNLWFDCMNGDSRETGKLTPKGKPDPSVFSTEQNKEGIRVGTAIALMVRKGNRQTKPVTRFRHFWGASKRSDLLQSLQRKRFDREYEAARPEKINRFSFPPMHASRQYLSWPPVPALAAKEPYNGPIERRALALISIDKYPLAVRMRKYFDPRVANEEIANIYPSLMMTGNRIVGPDARKKIISEFTYDERCIVRYPFKPFDARWCYLENLRPLFSEPSPELMAQSDIPHNKFFITRDTADKTPEGPPFYLSSVVCDYDFISGHARHFPVRVRLAAVPKDKHNGKKQGFFVHEAAAAYSTANLSATAREYLRTLRITDTDKDSEAAELIWLHALAVGYSPAYLAENADGIRQDWPRIPLPNSKRLLRASAELGKKIAALLDTEKQVPGVTTGRIRSELKTLGVISRAGGGSLNPDAGDLDLTAGWGHAGKGSVTMPGKGKLAERAYADAEREALGADAIPVLGKKTRDVFLNGVAYWKNIPERVWDYTIGGYQVIKKWLSYREKPLLGRTMKMEEVEYVTEMVRRIAALVFLESELDANYQAVKANTYPWPR